MMIIRLSLILTTFALSTHMLMAMPCCFGRKEKVKEPNEEPIRLFTISEPRLVSSTHEIAQPMVTRVPEDIPEVPRLQYDMVLPQAPQPPSTPNLHEPSRSHLQARPMPFRGNTDFNNYREEMRIKGVQHIIPTTPSESENNQDEDDISIPPPLRTSSFRTAKEYFGQQH